MKRLIIVFSSLLLLLVACGSSNGEGTDNNERFSGNSSHGGENVIIDNETGCKYIYVKVANSGGLSIMYDENGEIDCGK